MTSVDGACESRMQVSEKGISFDLVFRNDTILKKVNLVLHDTLSVFSDNFVVDNSRKSNFSETWKTVNGKNSTVLNEYNLFEYDLKSDKGWNCTLQFRLYNMGFAYRILFPSDFTDVTEISRIGFGNDFTFWAYNGEQHNVGPVSLSAYGENNVKNPVTFKTAQHYFTLYEAAIFDHAPFVLENTANQTFVLTQEIEATQSTRTSWRAFVLGETPGDLIESDLIVNLNEPCKIDDTSWIKPGRSMWDWRVWGYTAPDGFRYGLDTRSHKRFIDFAAANNVQYLLIDADWYGPEFDDTSDPTSAREGVDIEQCMAYAKSHGVGIILYLNDVGAKKFGLERVLKQFSDWGVSGIKYGFMSGTPKEKVLNTRRIVELCAKYKLTVNFHDNPIAPSGDRRTWPNLITKEFGHAQADAKRSYYPETIVTVPFVNMVAGPLDLTNGWFSLNTAFTSGRPKVFAEIPGTVAAEVAKLIVIQGGYFVLPDAPEEYLKKDDLFECIRNMPAHFDSYHVLNGQIGEFICVARRAGNNWFVGSLTNREERELEITFDFLEKGKDYRATFYEDDEDTHFLDNKEKYKVREVAGVTCDSKVQIKLAPGGGHSIWLRPMK